jgi:hypothetical protein
MLNSMADTARRRRETGAASVRFRTSIFGAFQADAASGRISISPCDFLRSDFGVTPEDFMYARRTVRGHGQGAARISRAPRERFARKSASD